MSTAARGTGLLHRVTLVGERRRIDMVLPSEAPVGELLPDLLGLLGEEAGGVPLLRRLMTSDGAVLTQDETLASAGIVDGAVLRLVREQETPAAPVVHDVTDEVAEDLDRRDWRWGESSRLWTAGGGAVLLGVVTAVLAWVWLGADAVGGWLVGAALGCAALGGLAARLGGRPLGAALIVLGGALGGPGAWALSGSGSGPGGAAKLAALGLVAVVTLMLLGVFTAVGRGGLIAAAAVVLLVGGWEAGIALVPEGEGYRVGVVMGVVSVLGLGLLPRLALTASGLTALDDRRSGGASVSRQQVDTALAATHRGLTLATVVTAASAAAAGWLAVDDGAGGSGGANGWAVTVTALLAVVLLSRSRAFPLSVEVVSLLLAGTALIVRLVVLWAERSGDGGDGTVAGPLIALGVLAALPLTLFVVRPPDHVRARMRRLANLVESVGVLALIPVAVGAFGVYGRLLDTF
ncbi:type VII secretion integral membrane protein EccD [Streptomyces johnsoniae]|uniref:Type VII secretion integral membrane protein EccD n=1 Tax=Streptomyces johnsoniae TaxID=3075532 RepID=A0ABU2S390_9ACTN|nr:type VII secretion integral membrane protein EccD [Streptomyces sp. DSM 41886]MDT0443425.1 type VII secretion integral membrane protein EccD [Streptomyces sp. DSM 41886]